MKLSKDFSKWLPVLSGIPRGSVLGPSLCVMFVNDLLTPVKIMPRFFSLWWRCETIKQVRTDTDNTMLQIGCERLLQWSSKWLLKLNIDKCKVVTIIRPRSTTYFTYYSVSGVGNAGDRSVLDRTFSIKDLGVIIDCKLKFIVVVVVIA